MKEYYCYDGNDVPVYYSEFSLFKPKQAEIFNKRFVDELDYRLEHFRKRCAADMNVSINALDYSHNSLLIVWQWFMNNVSLQRITDEKELNACKISANMGGDPLWEEFTKDSKRRMFDIAAYWGKCFIKLAPSLYWSYHAKPKSNVFLYQPDVRWFHEHSTMKILDEVRVIDMDVLFAPVHMVTVQASNVFTKDISKYDLYNVHKIWLEKIPK